MEALNHLIFSRRDSPGEGGSEVQMEMVCHDCSTTGGTVSQILTVTNFQAREALHGNPVPKGFRPITFHLRHTHLDNRDELFARKLK